MYHRAARRRPTTKHSSNSTATAISVRELLCGILVRLGVLLPAVTQLSDHHVIGGSFRQRGGDDTNSNHISLLGLRCGGYIVCCVEMSRLLAVPKLSVTA